MAARHGEKDGWNRVKPGDYVMAAMAAAMLYGTLVLQSPQGNVDLLRKAFQAIARLFTSHSTMPELWRRFGAINVPI